MWEPSPMSRVHPDAGHGAGVGPDGVLTLVVLVIDVGRWFVSGTEPIRTDRRRYV